MVITESKPKRKPRSKVSDHGSKDIGQKIIYIDRNKIIGKGKRALPIICAEFRKGDGKLAAYDEAAEVYIDGPCTIVFSPERYIEMGGVLCWVQTESSVNIVTESEVVKVR